MRDLRRAQENLKTADLERSVLNACLEFTRALEELGDGQGHFLPFSFFLASSEKTPPAVAFSALSYMCSMDCAPLSMHGYIHDFQDEVVVLDDKDFLHAVAANELVHPRTGELVERASDHLYLFYSVIE